jgi:hypothetical protein
LLRARPESPEQKDDCSIFAGLVALWGTLRLRTRRDFRRSGPARLHLSIGIFFLAVFHGSFTILFLKNPVQPYRVVDEPWQYSRLWLAGADSVTSNVVQTFAAMARPVLALVYPAYLLIWGLVGLLAVGLCFSRH